MCEDLAAQMVSESEDLIIQCIYPFSMFSIYIANGRISDVWNQYLAKNMLLFLNIFLLFGEIPQTDTIVSWK